jgi:hypothetical protein
MSRRPHVSPDDSLELLLDTICNTFATVIFISMLASILAQNAAPQSAPEAEITKSIESVEALEAEAAELITEREQLENELTGQSELLKQFASGESLQLAAELRQTLADHSELLQQKSTASADRLRSEKQRLEAEKTLSQQLTELQQQQAVFAATESAVRELETREGREAIIRRVHETDKFPLAFALDNGRLYAVHQLAGSASGPADVTLNRTDCQITEVAGTTTVSLLPMAGTLIHNNANAEGQARLKFAGVPDTCVVQLFVARDSFADFLPIREALRSLQLEYSLQIMPGDDVELTLSERVREKTFVQ